MKPSLRLSFASLAALLFGCEVSDPFPKPTPKQEPSLVLPTATTVGANTLGFEIDGRVWVNYGRSCFLFSGGGCYDNVVRVQSGTRRGVRSIIVSADLLTLQRQESFALSIDTLRGPGTYLAGPPFVTLPPGTAGTGVNGIRLNDARFNRAYVSRANATRIVLTRVDTVRRIVSGTFDGQLEDGFNPGTFATIRNGRFDVTY